MKFDAAIDANSILDDGGTTFTASGAGEVSSSAQVIDLGADWQNIPVLAVVFDIASIDTADTDEVYVLEVEFANASGFASITGESVTTITAAGEHVIVSEAKDRYVRAFFGMSGTTPSLNANKVYYAAYNK